MASSSIRQPDDVLVSVASPLASGRSVRRTEGRGEALGRCFCAEHAQPDRDRQHSGCSRADQEEPTRRLRAANASLSLDALTQSRRRLDLGRSTPGKRDRPLLLGEPIGELRGRGHSCLELRATPGRERPVR